MLTLPGLLQVLWIDSDPRTLKAADFLLSERCHFHGAEALGRARQILTGGGFDLIFCEQQLPDGTGLDFMASLARESHPAFRIIIAGVGRMELLDQAMDLGLVHFSLTKPVRKSELTMLMSLVQERHQLRRQNSELLNKIEHQAMEIREAQALFSSLCEYLPEAIMVSDWQGRIQMANQRAEKALGADAQGLIGQSVEAHFKLQWPDAKSNPVTHQIAEYWSPELGGGQVEMSILRAGAQLDAPRIVLFPSS